MPLALKIILGFFGYLLTGCLSTFLVPIWINFWEMANLEFSGWEYDIDVRPDRIDFDEIYYKGELVSHGVRLYADGHLENYETCEIYWIEKAVKAILPLFRNEMVNLRIKKIL